jgi:hypothetical protein
MERYSSRRSGQGALLTDLNELNVSAFVIGRMANFAGTSAGGKVYKIDASKAEVYFEPKENTSGRCR